MSAAPDWAWRSPGPAHRWVCPYKIAKTPARQLILPALLIRDLFDHDRQVASDAVDRNRVRCAGELRRNINLLTSSSFETARQGVNVFDVDYAAFDDAGFEFELRVILGELAQHLASPTGSFWL